MQSNYEMRNKKLTRIRKLRILDEAVEYGNTKNSARKFGLQPTQNRNWRKNCDKIEELTEENLAKLNTYLRTGI